MLIGKDNGGACITIPIEPTIDKAIWRPVTGWYCKESELTALTKKERKE